MTDYEYYKSHHICVSCRKEDAEPDSIYCWECREKARERGRVKYEKEKNSIEYLNKKRISDKKRYEKRKSDGRCTSCGVLKAVPGKTRCQKCLNKRKRGGVSFPLRKYLGICLHCDKPVVEGYSLCRNHLEIQRQSIKKATMIHRLNSSERVRGDELK